jgi:hypothetical protein
MISDRSATKIIIGLLIAGFAYLGVAMCSRFVEGQTYSARR